MSTLNVLYFEVGIMRGVYGRKNANTRIYFGYQKWEGYFKKVESYIKRSQERSDKKHLLQIRENDGITKEQNIDLYLKLCHKLTDSIYKYRPNNQSDLIISSKEKFERLSCEEQCIALYEILWIFKCKPDKANLTLLGGAEQVGSTTL